MIIQLESSEWTPQQLKVIEKHYKAKYVLETCLRNQEGGWVNFPAAIFYTEEPHPQGSNYFAIYKDLFTGEVKITDGLNAIKDPIEGILIDDVVIYSHYRHDCRDYSGVFIDGGRDYVRVGGDRLFESKSVELNIVKDEVRVTIRS